MGTCYDLACCVLWRVRGVSGRGIEDGDWRFFSNWPDVDVQANIHSSSKGLKGRRPLEDFLGMNV